MNYTIGDFLIRVKNAYMARKKTFDAPYSKAIMSIGKILEEEKYIKKIKEIEKDGHKTLVFDLRYSGNRGAVNDIKLMSKPSLHSHMNKKGIKKTVTNYGISIVSTSKGMMTGKKALELGIGGELICLIS